MRRRGCKGVIELGFTRQTGGAKEFGYAKPQGDTESSIRFREAWEKHNKTKALEKDIQTETKLLNDFSDNLSHLTDLKKNLVDTITSSSENLTNITERIKNIENKKNKFKFVPFVTNILNNKLIPINTQKNSLSNKLLEWKRELKKIESEIKDTDTQIKSSRLKKEKIENKLKTLTI